MTRYQEIPWLRIGAESVAIVGSILLAFAIEAWWADQQQREEELILLTSLKEEAQNNLREIDRELVYRRAAADGVTKLLDASAGNSRLESMELDQLLGTLVWWSEASWSTGAFNGLIQGGRLALIESESLRSMIAALPELFDEVKRIELQDLETFRNALMPFLYKNALVPQLSNAQLVMPGGAGDFSQQRLPIGEQRDHTGLIENTEFIGIITHRFWDQTDAVDIYAQLRETLQKFTLAIDESMQE